MNCVPLVVVIYPVLLVLKSLIVFPLIGGIISIGIHLMLTTINLRYASHQDESHQLWNVRLGSSHMERDKLAVCYLEQGITIIRAAVAILCAC